MSFGVSPSDVVILVSFCKALYRKCRDAGGEYDEISCEVRDLHTVVRHLKYELQAPESPLNRDRSIWGRQLAPIVGDSDISLRQLDTLLQKYGRVTPSDKSSTLPRNRARSGNNEMDQLGAIRVKLISHKTSLTQFLDTIQLYQSGKVATALDNHEGQLDIILDKVDAIATRMTRRSGGVMTSSDDGDKEVWKQFRRELVAEGFSSDVLQQHKDVLRAYIREIDQKGLLDEVLPDTPIMPAAEIVNEERWLETVKSAPFGAVAPSFDALTSTTDDSGLKEMVIKEENMKFPMSMKLERPKPETKGDGYSHQLNAQGLAEPYQSGGIQRQASPIPKLITSDKNDPLYFNTSGSSSDDSGSDDSRKESKSLKGRIIRTTELIALCQALQIRPSGSPSSFKSNNSFADEDATRSMASRPKKRVQFGSSPSLPGSIPIPPIKTNSSNNRYDASSRLEPAPLSPDMHGPADRLGTSPRPDTLQLAPDSHGNEIPPDVKWTKIKRSLVSPEVLDQDGRRYEARTGFVAILGVLSRKEIQDYVDRSHDLRAARRRRFQQSIPPPKPPRPVQRPEEPRNGRETPPEEEGQESSGAEQHLRRSRSGEHRSFPIAGPSYESQSGHPNKFGAQAPLSPMWSPASTWSASQKMGQPVWMPQPPQNPGAQGGGIWIPNSPQPGQVYYPPKEREKEGARRRHNSPTRHSRAANRKETSKSRWRDNLTAASLGGAAVSLLDVLTEAAQGL